jgi:hypothetical protein
MRSGRARGALAVDAAALQSRLGIAAVTETLPEALRRLAGFLAEWGRPAAIVGGAAMVLRIRARPTRDIDLVLAVEPGGTDRLLDALVRHGYAYDAEETRQFLEGGLVRLWGPPDRATGFGLDVLFVDSPFMELVVQRAARTDLGGVELPVASAEDLLLMKLDANRPVDFEDAIAIKDAVGEALDLEYLRQQAAGLDLTRRLALLFGEQLG